MGRPLFTGDPSALVLIPVQVETAFRGVETGSVIMVQSQDSSFDKDQFYLMYGFRTPGSDVIDLQIREPANAESARMAIRLFASSMPVANRVTVFGAVGVGSSPDQPRMLPVSGLRIRVSSNGFVKDIVTADDGVFSLSGIPPGRLELKPFLPATLKVLDTEMLSHEASADECVIRTLFVVANRKER